MTRGDAHYAQPRLVVPAGTPAPFFRVQLEVRAAERSKDGRAAVVLQVDSASKGTDPEQRILAPIFNNGSRLIFEFERADVFFVSRNGEVELRSVAVNPETGQVGTQTRFRFHRRYAGLAARCEAYLAGTVDLFPVQHTAPRHPAAPVPTGTPNLGFGEERTPAGPLSRETTGAGGPQD